MTTHTVKCPTCGLVDRAPDIDYMASLYTHLDSGKRIGLYVLVAAQEDAA